MKLALRPSLLKPILCGLLGTCCLNSLVCASNSEQDIDLVVSSNLVRYHIPEDLKAQTYYKLPLMVRDETYSQRIKRYIQDQGNPDFTFPAQIGSMDNIWSLLCMSSDKGDSDLVSFLRLNGACDNSRDTYGITPLHRAAFRGHTAVIECLLEPIGVEKRRANAFGLDDFGLTPGDYLRLALYHHKIHGRHEIKGLLDSAEEAELIEIKNKSEQIRNFVNVLIRNCKSLLTSHQLLKVGMIARSSNALSFSNIISVLGNVVSVPGTSTITVVAGGAASAVEGYIADKKTGDVLDHSAALSNDMDREFRKLAYFFADLYEEPLQMLSLLGAEQLAKFSAKRVLKYVEQIDSKDDPKHVSFINQIEQYFYDIEIKPIRDKVKSAVGYSVLDGTRWTAREVLNGTVPNTKISSRKMKRETKSDVIADIMMSDKKPSGEGAFDVTEIERLKRLLSDVVVDFSPTDRDESGMASDFASSHTSVGSVAARDESVVVISNPGHLKVVHQEIHHHHYSGLPRISEATERDANEQRDSLYMFMEEKPLGSPVLQEHEEKIHILYHDGNHEEIAKEAKKGDPYAQAYWCIFAKENEFIDKSKSKVFAYIERCRRYFNENMRGVQSNNFKYISQYIKEFEQDITNGNVNYQLIKLADKEGHADSQHLLAYRLSELGEDVHAFEYYKLAAENGNAEAQFQLGEIYKNGRCVERNEEEAKKWYEFAAKKNHVRAYQELEKIQFIIELKSLTLSQEAKDYIRSIYENQEDLQHLSLCSLEANDSAIFYVSKSLTLNTVLQTLDLGWNNITHEGIRYLSKSLKVNTALYTLILYNNKINDSGALFLSDALKNNHGLRSLNLSCCLIGDSGAVSLSCALKNNTSLKDLDLSWNKIDQEGAISLIQMLNLNWTLYKINIKNNKVKTSYIKSIVNESNRIEY